MDKEVSELLYSVPKGLDYTDIPEDLDLEDIPEDHMSKVMDLLNHSDSYVVFQAARLLTNWGQDSGFFTLVELQDRNDLEGFIDHRLHSYDDTLHHVLNAFVGYWATQATLGFEEQARIKIFPPIAKIIERSNAEPFHIRHLFWIIEDYKYNEYIPLIKNHLTKIIDHPELHFWKIHDAIDLMLKLESDFVHRLLEQKGKTLKDFKIE